MTSNTNRLLMDEDRIRAALQPFRTERAAFESAVTQHMEELKAIRASAGSLQRSVSDLR